MAKKLGKLVAKTGQEAGQLVDVAQDVQRRRRVALALVQGRTAVAAPVRREQRAAGGGLHRAEDARGARATRRRTAALKALRTQLAVVKGLIAKTKEGEDDEHLQKKIEDALNLMADNLVLLLSDTEWGTQDNPAPLDYEKRRSASYPTFYLGQGAADGAHAGPDEGQLSASRRTRRPSGGICRSDPRSRPATRTTLGLVGRESGGCGLEVRVRRQGRARQPGRQVQGPVHQVRHAARATTAGTSTTSSSCRLAERTSSGTSGRCRSGENRSSGSIIKHATTKKPGNKDISVQDAHQKRKKEPKGALALAAHHDDAPAVTARGVFAPSRANYA